jgi:chaperonin GroEL
VVAKVRQAQWGHGFDAEEQAYRDLVAAGIVDPVKVTRSAIVNAASIARMVITTESAVVDKPEKAPPAGHGHGHGHGPGM